MEGSVSAIFKDRDAAARAVVQLRDAGIRDDELRVIAGAHADTTQSFEQHAEAMKHQDASRGAWAGTALGSAVGGLVGLGLITLTFNPAIPLFVVGGAGLGAVMGELRGLRLAHGDARADEETLRAGGVLIVVSGDAKRQDLARDILHQAGAESIAREEPVTPV